MILTIHLLTRLIQTVLRIVKVLHIRLIQITANYLRLQITYLGIFRKKILRYISLKKHLFNDEIQQQNSSQIHGFLFLECFFSINS